MLPLWIIDITNQTDRQGVFKHLVGQIGHVHIADILARSEDCNCFSTPNHSSEDTVPPSEDMADGDVENHSIETDVTEDDNSIDASVTQDLGNVLTTKELIEEEEKRKAEKNAIIKGDYWYYTTICNYFNNIDKEDKEAVAHCLYDFQSDLVTEAQRFIEMIRCSNVKPYQTLNIIVLGDITEELTRIVFPSIAALLQKERGRFLPHHIHQGMEIMGMLYVPCDINARDIEERQAIKKTLMEIEVQHQITSIRGYDHMILYQNVQNRTECNYSMLDPKGQAEYLLQCLVHLFFACDKTHPLISGTSSADDFYLSLGATSVFYDMSIEDEKERIRLENNIIRFFKEKGDADSSILSRPLISDTDYSPGNHFQGFTPKDLELDDIDPKDPSPWHPIRNFFAKRLKRYYYNAYLRFFPANYYHRITAQIEEKTREQLELIAALSKRKFADAETRLQSLIEKELGNLTANEGGLPHIISSLKDMQLKLSNNRTEIRPYLNHEFWQSVEKRFRETSQEDSFLDYHDVYQQDVKSKNKGSGCENMKSEAKNNLQQLLSSETTLLSTIGRCFLAGIVCVIALIPLLVDLSPNPINLGDVDNNKFYWSIPLFCLPIIIHLIKYWWYSLKKKKLLLILKTYYIHDAYARVANRIDSEINLFYDKLISLCEAYISRSELIRKEIGLESDELVNKSEIPITMFNQPLAGGMFGDGELLPSEKNDDCEVKVNYIRRKANSLLKSDYYLLISQFHHDFEYLYKGIYLTENFKLRVNEENGEEELITKAQQEKEISDSWEKNKVKFRKELTDSIKSIMIPRENSTIGDKLIAYSLNTRRHDTLLPVIDFAANNGEVTSSADTEYADVKTNKEQIIDFSSSFLPVANTKYQVEKYDALYKKYIFVSRWRSFNHFSFNRILPTEDFDVMVHKNRVYGNEEEKEFNHADYISSISLWALCPDDASSEWLTLFRPENFKEAFEVRELYRKIINQND